MANQYQDYVSALKEVVSVETASAFPRVMVLHGPSEFLRMRAMSACKTAWSKLDPGETQQLEATLLDHVGFRSLWAQISLFEPESVYVLRRCDKMSKLGVWLKEIKSASSIKTHLLFEFGEKIPAEIGRQLTRLNAVMLPCVEPATAAECGKVIATLARREGVILGDDAVRLLLESMGPDLGRLDNEVQKLALIYHGRKEPLTAGHLSSVVGHMREDHVFELFNLLRNRQRAKAQLLIESLLERGEKAIALVGILSRFARESIGKNATRGVLGVQLCADADVRLKSSPLSETLILGRIVDALVEA